MRRFWTTRPLQILFPNLVWRTTSDGVHLTFDDGPDPVATPKVLDLLSQHGAKATFFLLGSNIEKHPEIARRASQEGHTLGVHSYDHLRLAFRSRRMIQDQIKRTKDAIQSATGKDATLFRPPFGFFEPSMIKHVTQMGLSTVMWDVDPGDAMEGNPDLVVARVSSGVRSGSIILLHDNANTGERIESTLPRILEILTSRSLRVLPLSL